MRLSAGDEMNAGKMTTDRHMQGRNVYLGEVHIDCANPLGACYVHPVYYRQVQLHSESRVNTTLGRACIHQGRKQIRRQIGLTFATRSKVWIKTYLDI